MPETTTPDVDFTTSDEQQLLRETATKYLADHSDSSDVRELMGTDPGFSEDQWSELAQMGWLGLAVPEEHGGAGYGWPEAGVVFEEAGSALLCAPLLSSAVLATAALLEAGGDVADELLPQLAVGERRAALAHVTDRAEVALDGETASGSAGFVLDGHTAHELLLPATRDGQPVLVAVAADQDGVETSLLPTLDLTRKQADVTLDGASARVVAEGDAADAAVARARLVGAVLLACEQVGGADEVLQMSVQYGKERRQFGRAIGSYQALKHRMADTLKDLESARSAAYHAVRSLDDPAEAEIAAAVAVSWCGEVYEHAAGDNIQNHGGIGFTWEHDAHLHFKRAKTSKLLFGGGRAWRDRLGRALGV